MKITSLMSDKERKHLSSCDMGFRQEFWQPPQGHKCRNIIVMSYMTLPTVCVTPFWMGWVAGSLRDANDPFKDGNCWIWRQKRSLVSFGRVKGTDMRKPN